MESEGAVMDWTKGFSANYHITTVDPLTWRDVDRIEITGGSIKKEKTGLMQSANVDCIRYEQGTERWIRVWLDASQEGDNAHDALFTGLACSPEREFEGVLETNTLECYSVLKVADDVLLERGWYAPSGVTGSNIVKQLLSITPAPIIEEEGSPQLQSAIIAEDGESRLSMAQKILDAIGWRLRISGYGTITICPYSNEAVIVIDSIEYDIVEPKVTVKNDWYDCPNVFRAVDDDVSAVARDDSINSPLSTVNRGREIWKEETNCHLNDKETVAEYAIRRLKEEQSVAVEYSYKRRYVPGVEPSDVIRIHYPAQDIDSYMEVKSQSISIGYGASVSESVVKA